jgi:NAD(P)-dependent dehydrogenase (short-subunit alcohol dehydrogenase family)
VHKMGGLVAAGGHALAMDARDGDRLDRAVATVVEEQGRIDVLVNNAGTVIHGSVEEVPLIEARDLFEVNVIAPARLVQLVLPHMRKQGGGTIVNVSSVGGVIALPLGACTTRPSTPSRRSRTRCAWRSTSSGSTWSWSSPASSRPVSRTRRPRSSASTPAKVPIVRWPRAWRARRKRASGTDPTPPWSPRSCARRSRPSCRAPAMRSGTSRTSSWSCAANCPTGNGTPSRPAPRYSRRAP